MVKSIRLMSSQTKDNDMFKLDLILKQLGIITTLLGEIKDLLSSQGKEQ